MSPSSSPSFPFSPCVIYIRRRSSLVGMTARQTWKGLPHATQAAGQSRPVARRHVGMVGECPAKKETRPAWRMESPPFHPSPLPSPLLLSPPPHEPLMPPMPIPPAPLAVFCKQSRKLSPFPEIFPANSCTVPGKSLPLHPLLRAKAHGPCWQGRGERSLSRFT